MNDGCIDATKPYGQHIPLACINHPTKRWSTKNIAPIGARSIFYNLGGYKHPEVDMGPECACSVQCLFPLDTSPNAKSDVEQAEECKSL